MRLSSPCRTALIAGIKALHLQLLLLLAAAATAAAAAAAPTTAGASRPPLPPRSPVLIAACAPPTLGDAAWQTRLIAMQVEKPNPGPSSQGPPARNATELPCPQAPPPSAALATSAGSASAGGGSSGSSGILSSLSVSLLVHNLMPRPLPAAAAAVTTAAAWLWLAFSRLQPWLLQLGTSAAAASAGGSRGADATSGAVAAAAGLSPQAAAAAAATAAAGAGLPGGAAAASAVAWWQHALLYLELGMGSVTDAAMLVGLLLLPVIAARRWLAGKRIGGAIPAAAAAEGAAPAGGTAGAASAALAQAAAAGRASRLASDAANALLHSSAPDPAAGGCGAAGARRRGSIDSAGSGGTVSSSSSTGSMVSPEQSAVQQPATPPLLFVARPDGPLGAQARPRPGSHDQAAAGAAPTSTAGASTLHATAADTSDRPSAGAPPVPLPPPAAAKPPLVPASSPGSSPGGSASGSRRSSADVARAAGTKAVSSPGDTGKQPPSHARDSSPAGSFGRHSGQAGSAAVSGLASLNLGHLRAPRAVVGRPPMHPPRALYSSPMETVVVSCKLSSSASSSATTSLAASSSSSTSDLGGAAAAAAAAAGPAQPGAASARLHALPPAASSLAPAGSSNSSSGHGASISAQQQLRQLVEAAVRQAVAASHLGVLSTTVTSFPGCVHVVATVTLAAPLGAGGGAAVPDASSAPAAAAAAANAAGMAWEQVVQQILADGSRLQPGADGSDADSSPAGILAQEGLQLRHLLVQGASGQVHCLWVSPHALQQVIVDAAGSSDDGSAPPSPLLPAAATKEAASSAGRPLADTAGETNSSAMVAPGLLLPRNRSTQPGLLSSSAAGRLPEAASPATLSSFALPTDALPAAPLEAAALGTTQGGVSAATGTQQQRPHVMLQLPPALIDALDEAGAGLRVVMTGSAGGAQPVPASPDNRVRGEATPGGPVGSSSAGSTTLTAPYVSNSPAAAAAMDAVARFARGQAAAAGGGAQQPHLLVDHTLWPCTSSWPHTGCIDVLQLLPAGVDAAELATLHGPVLTLNLVASTPVPGSPAAAAAAALSPAAQAADSADAAASIVHTTLAGGIPDASPVSDSSRTPDSARAAPKAPQPAAVALGEHLLLQLPLLLLPSAACYELQLLLARMAQELGGDSQAAARRHMLPLVRDLAAVLELRPSAPVGAGAAHTVGGPAAAEGAGGAAAAPPQVQPLAACDSNTAGALAQQLLQFLAEQGLEHVAACLTGPGGIQPLRQQAPAPGAPEIEQADAGSGTKPGTAAPPLGPAAAPPAGPSMAAAEPQAGTPAGSDMGPAANDAAPPPGALGSKHAAKVMEQATAAHQQAIAAQRAAAATGEALQLALQQISALTAAATEASRQAADAEAAAAAATRRAAAVEAQAERRAALQFIGLPAGTVPPSSRGVGIWGLLSGSVWAAAAAARADGSGLLGGSALSAAEPPQLPAEVGPRQVLLGFEDERLEVQYRRVKALQARPLDRAALVLQLVRQVVYVWRIARLMFVSAGTGLSLVLLCKYEAVVLLPYLMLLLCPDFFMYHRQLLLCLSQIAAALTVGMIATTEVYRNEWTALLSTSGPVLLARPSMMLAWYYLVVPLLQQQTLPEQAISCVAQLAHSLLIYVYILKGTASLFLAVPLLLAASGLSFALTYVVDAHARARAVAAARRGLPAAAAAPPARGG